jgi:drug/metabolite transporter (DMT)-like permease
MAELFGLLSAALFGASAPLAKVLLADTHFLVLAGLLYLGAGTAAWLAGLRTRDRFSGADWKWLAGVMLFGGLIGPGLLMFGLQRTAASVSSLLLNLEAVFTAVIAVAAFHERIGLRGVIALLLVVGGAALLSFEPGGTTRSLLGPLSVVGATLAWGIDNNLTQKLSHRDPLLVVRYKGLFAGTASLAIGLLAGGHLPGARATVPALGLGALGYGLSMVFYLRALRTLGAARTGMLFATAPFAGALISIAFLGEPLRLILLVAGAIMAAGVVLLVKRGAGTASGTPPSLP